MSEPPSSAVPDDPHREVEELQRAYRRLASLLDATTEPVWSVDERLRLVAFNRAFAALGELAWRRPVVGRSALDALHAELRPGWETAYRTALDGKTSRIELVVGTGEATRWFLVTLRPQLAEDGSTCGAVAVAQETSEVRRTRDLLERSRDAAEAASQAKSDFLAHISHEIRTPLNAIVGMTELTLDTDLTDRQRRLLHTVRMNTEALLHLITDILDFSKIEAGQMDLEAVVCSFADVVEEVVEFLAVSAARKRLRLLCDIAPDVPRGVLADPNRLRQVVTNLVSNAIKYTERGEVVVRLRARPLQDRLNRIEFVFSVADTGIGIAAKDQAQVFSRFYRVASSTSGRTSGTGLGLSITRSLVQIMGGRIELKSEPQRGSLFKVRLPLLVDGSRAESPRLDGLRVLIVDSHPVSSAWMGQVAEQAGAQVVVARDPAEIDAALAVPGAHDVAIIDQDAEGVDPMTLPRRLGRGRTRCVFLVDPTRSFGGTEGLFDGLLVRPPRLSGLLAALGGDSDGMSAPTEESSVRPAAPLRPPGRIRTAPPAERTLSRAARILLVEDNPDNQQVALGILTGAGHEVAVASDGRAAIEAARLGPHDLILMDVHMPGMDGIEATAHLRSDEALDQRARTPIVALTAHATDAIRQRCLRVGMDDFATKPIVRERLIGLVERWVRTVPRLLVVDDDADTRTLLRELLQRFGAQVLEAASGDDAIRQVADLEVDLVLMDVEMPGTNGLDATRALREAGHEVPILVTSGHVGTVFVDRCIAAGCTGYLAKPVSKDALFEAVAGCLRRGGGAAPEVASGAPPGRAVARQVDPDIADLVPMYLTNRRSDVLAMRDLLQRGEFGEVMRLGHSMKGSGTPYGFPELTELGGLLENAARARDRARTEELIHRVASIVDGAS